MLKTLIMIGVLSAGIFGASAPVRADPAAFQNLNSYVETKLNPQVQTELPQTAGVNPVPTPEVGLAIQGDAVSKIVNIFRSSVELGSGGMRWLACGLTRTLPDLQQRPYIKIDITAPEIPVQGAVASLYADVPKDGGFEPTTQSFAAAEGLVSFLERDKSNSPDAYHDLYNGANEQSAQVYSYTTNSNVVANPVDVINQNDVLPTYRDMVRSSRSNQGSLHKFTEAQSDQQGSYAKHFSALNSPTAGSTNTIGTVSIATISSDIAMKGLELSAAQLAYDASDPSIVQESDEYTQNDNEGHPHTYKVFYLNNSHNAYDILDTMELMKSSVKQLLTTTSDPRVHAMGSDFSPMSLSDFEASAADTNSAKTNKWQFDLVPTQVTSAMLINNTSASLWEGDITITKPQLLADAASTWSTLAFNSSDVLSTNHLDSKAKVDTSLDWTFSGQGADANQPAGAVGSSGEVKLEYEANQEFTSQQANLNLSYQNQFAVPSFLYNSKIATNGPKFTLSAYEQYRPEQDARVNMDHSKTSVYGASAELSCNTLYLFPSNATSASVLGLKNWPLTIDDKVWYFGDDKPTTATVPLHQWENHFVVSLEIPVYHDPSDTSSPWQGLSINYDVGADETNGYQHVDEFTVKYSKNITTD